MVNYQKGKIYEITSEQTQNIYIGSSCSTLKQRLQSHKCYLNVKKPCQSTKILQFDDAIITLLEDYPCNSKEELEKREAQWIKSNLDICVNKQIPQRKDKERYANNINGRREKQIANAKVQREKHPERREVKMTCECGVTGRREDKARHEKSLFHQEFIKNKV